MLGKIKMRFTIILLDIPSAMTFTVDYAVAFLLCPLGYIHLTSWGL